MSARRSEELRVHVRVGKIARARKELLDVGLVRQVRGVLLEDRVVERERVTDRDRTRTLSSHTLESRLFFA